MYLNLSVSTWDGWARASLTSYIASSRELITLAETRWRLESSELTPGELFLAASDRVLIRLDRSDVLF